MAFKFNNDGYNKFLDKFINEEEILAYQKKVNTAVNRINKKTGRGKQYLGWADLPVNYDKDEFDRIKEEAAKIRDKCDIFIVIGIGGSYLGARAAIEFVESPRYNNLEKNKPKIYFTGNDMNSAAYNELIELCKDKSVYINVISKSGRTTEPAIAFRLLRAYLETRYTADEIKERIYVTTDKVKGALKTLSDGVYTQFVVPEDTGGRYSVLTAVGLLPIAVAGIDIKAMMEGAAEARKEFYLGSTDVNENNCYRYAVIRNILYNKGKLIEIMVNYDSGLLMFSEWWKQLFGESEGKDGKAIFPASVSFSTDLHSLGQIIQQGERNIFETVINVVESSGEVKIPMNTSDLDELNYIAEKEMTLHDLNATAMKATILAHVAGDVPNIVFDLDRKDAANFGYLAYFFELACAVSGYMLGVNPFDQPGVEAYKDNMFALLGKPGKESDKIREDIRELLEEYDLDFDTMFEDINKKN
jgi:Glucose-6-phosphate isomerase